MSGDAAEQESYEMFRHAINKNSSEFLEKLCRTTKLVTLKE